MRKIVRARVLIGFIAVLIFLSFSLLSFADSFKWAELKGFHNVLRVYWHTYYPSDDFDAMKINIEKLTKAYEVLQKAPIPADAKNKEDLKAKIDMLGKSVEAVAKACKGADNKVLKESVSAMHDSFHDLVICYKGEESIEEKGE